MFDPGPGTWSFRKQPRSRAGCRSGPWRTSLEEILIPRKVRHVSWSLRAHRSLPDLGRRVRSEAAPVPPRQKTSGPRGTRRSRTDLRRCGPVFKRGPRSGSSHCCGNPLFSRSGRRFFANIPILLALVGIEPVSSDPEAGATIAAAWNRHHREARWWVRCPGSTRASTDRSTARNASSRLSGCRRARLSSLEHGGSPFRKL